MRLHRHAFKDRDCWRGFVTWYSKDQREQVRAQLEITTTKMVGPGFKLHLGDRGSETPIDVMLGLHWVSFFGGLDFPGLGKACEIIGGGHKRDISLRFHDGKVWWRLWYDDDGGYDSYHRCDGWRKPKLYPWRWGREKHRGWMCLRDGSLDLNPLDAFWGHRSYSYHDAAPPIRALVPVNQFPGDEYEVEFTLQKQTRGRLVGPAFARRRSDEGWIVEWDAGKGIPNRNHSWKGDNVLASAEKIDLTTGEDWVQQAVKSLIKRIKKDRLRYNYRPPEEAEV